MQVTCRHATARLTARLLLSAVALCFIAVMLAVVTGWWMKGEEVAFLVTRPGMPQLYTMDVNTHIKRVLAHNLHWVKPAWSPDGSQIAFVTPGEAITDPFVEIGTEAVVNVMDADGRNAHALRSLQISIYGLAWSPDGTRLTLDTKDGIFVMNVDGSNLRRLALGYSSTWSPDGTRIIFERDRLFYVMDADGQNVSRVHTGLRALRPDWSPDGQRIAFYAQVARSFYLYTFNLDSGETQRIFSSGRGCFFFPEWSPDGTRIAFEFNCSQPAGIYIVDADGGDLQLLVRADKGTTALRPSWRPRG